MSGIELLNQVAALDPKAIRVLLSGYEDKSVVMSALAKGLAHHYVLKPWNDADLMTLIEQSLERVETLRAPRLDGILRSIETLPSPPTLHVEIQAVLAREGSSVRDIARELEKSPSVVAKLLRVANSIYFGSRKAVTTVQDALFFIGTEYVGGLVASIEAFHGFSVRGKSGINERVEKLWQDSFGRALIAKKIAHKWPGCSGLDEVFISSLLQDIGYAVFICYEPEQYAEYERSCEDGGVSHDELEQKFFGHTHAEVGSALLEYWNLPAAIVAAVAKHHQPVGDDALLQILQVADVLCRSDKIAPHDPALDDAIASWREELQDDIEAMKAAAPSER